MTRVSIADVAARIHYDMVTDERNGYNQQPVRWGGDHPNGTKTLTINDRKYTYKLGSYDCSSSVITAWRLALQGTPYQGKLDAATYTGDMRSVFVGSGLFTASLSPARRGDLYLAESKHTAMCQDGGSDGVFNRDVLSEFNRNERHAASYGAVGDQDGQEAVFRGYYDDGWNTVLHYNGRADYDVPDPKPLGYSTKLYRSNNTANQQWRIEDAGNGCVRIKNVGRGMYLDVRGGESAERTPVRVWEANTSDAQVWRLIKVKGKIAELYELEPRCAPGMRLEAVNGGTTDKTGIWLVKANGGSAQRWLLVDSQDGIFRIASSKSGLCLDSGSGVQ